MHQPLARGNIPAYCSGMDANKTEQAHQAGKHETNPQRRCKLCWDVAQAAKNKLALLEVARQDAEHREYLDETPDAYENQNGTKGRTWIESDEQQGRW